MMRHSPGANGRRVMNAISVSSSWMILAGARPATISQKMQLMVSLGRRLAREAFQETLGRALFPRDAQRFAHASFFGAPKMDHRRSGAAPRAARRGKHRRL